MTTEAITEPPQVEITETTLKYRVVKIWDNQKPEIVKETADFEEAYNFLIHQFLTHTGERDWRWRLLERKKILTVENMFEV